MRSASKPALAPSAAIRGAPIRSYSAMLLAWMFDFQADASGAGLAFQAAFAVLYVIALVVFLIADHGPNLRIQGMRGFLASCGLFLGVGLVSGLIAGQPVYAVFRNGLAVFVYSTGTYATARMVIGANPARLRLLLALACLGYALSGLLITLLLRGGIDFSHVRFQIVGASVFAALGYLALLVVFRLSRVELVTMALNFVLVFLSVTRTFLLAAAVQLLPALRNARRAFGPRMLVFLVVVIAILLGAFAFGEAGLERWADRITNQSSVSGSNATWETRLSEWQFMWDAFLGSVQAMLFGNGLAAETVYWIPREIGGGFDTSIGYGHNQYISLLFIAGLVGGLPLIVVQAVQGWRAFGLLSATIRAGRSRSDLLFLGAWGAAIVLGSMMANVFSANFGSRGGAFWYAIGTGLLLGVQALFDPANRPLSKPGPAARNHRSPARQG